MFWPGFRYFSTIFYRALEEIQPHQGRLAALPGDRHLRRPVRFEELADVGLQQLIGHAEAAAGIEHLLG